MWRMRGKQHDHYISRNDIGSNRMKKGRERLVSISGIIIPVGWDVNGKVLTTALSTHSEDEYLIDENYNGRELLHFIQKDVEVSGVVREEEDKKIITVKKYILRKIQDQKGGFKNEKE